MSDATPATNPAANIAEYSVSELSQALKRTVEDAYGYVRVRGEVGRVSRPGSGHVYLDLKDERAVLSGVIWKGIASRLAMQPEQGLEVIATGKLTTFPGQSKYQIVIEAIEPAGVGALMALLEERKKALAAEGLFDEARKQLLPYLPDVIGVVTSPTGAVIRDILHRLADRFPRRVVVWPVRVQGEKCAGEVAAAIAGFNALEAGGPVPRPDLIIVARGGGALEELWGFNEEIVVRAAAASDIPLISAVGHETDWTLIDLAADVRAPTPTAAAEMAVPVRAELLARLEDLSGRAMRGLARLFAERRGALRAAERGLPRLGDLLALPRQRFDIAGERLVQALRVFVSTHRHTLGHIARRLSPQALRQRVRRETVRLEELNGRARRALPRAIELARRAVAQAQTRLSTRLIGERLARESVQIEGLSRRARRALASSLASRRAGLDASAKLLTSLSYHNVLARGFALVRDAQGQMVRSAAALSPADAIDIEFADGRRGARVEGEPGQAGRGGGRGGGRKAAKPSAKRKGGADQGTLFR